jgi:hypothetical protein
MKCLIQRRYAYDLFDLVYGVFVNRELDVDRAELVQTFLRKTIFEPSPVAARDLLLGVPFDLMRGFWSKVVGPAEDSRADASVERWRALRLPVPVAAGCRRWRLGHAAGRTPASAASR